MSTPEHFGKPHERVEIDESAMVDEPAFRDFAARLIAGEDAAAAEFLQRFSTRLVTLARARLSPGLATKCDPEDVVQSVMRTFFRRVGTGEVELRDWHSLWSLLALLTIRKCAKQGRRYGTAGRDVHREATESDEDASEGAIPSREPTPLEVATFVDLLRHLVASVTRQERLVIEGLIAGETVVDLAERLGRTERTVYRIIERLRQNLLSKTEQPSDG